MLHLLLLAADSSDVRIADALTILTGRRIDVFDGAAARVATYELPFTRLWWNAVGSLIVAVGEAMVVPLSDGRVQVIDGGR